MLFGLIPGIGPQEMIVVAIVGVLLFGKRLPEVGRSLGKGLVEFKKGLRGLEDEFESGSRPNVAKAKSATIEPLAAPADIEANVPKFEPPTSAPAPPSESVPEPQTQG
ncbi:hypothetical protein BH23PLA1_BH23PLA1_01330 [soil metagenome]